MAEIENEDLVKLSEGITRGLLLKLEDYTPVLFERVSDYALSLTAAKQGYGKYVMVNTSFISEACVHIFLVF